MRHALDPQRTRRRPGRVDLKRRRFLVPRLLIAGAALLLTGAQRAPVAREPSIGDFADALPVAEPGCNATAFAQLPGDPTLFLGRQLVGADGGLAGITSTNDCSGGDPANESAGKPFNRWSLTLVRLDWRTRRFTIVKPLIDTSLDRRTGRSAARITGGAMRGAIIRSGYDPSVVRFGGSDVVVFECTIENGSRYGSAGTSVCLSIYDPKTRTLDMARTRVLVAGGPAGAGDQVGAVPRLLAFGGRLYLYWSAMTIRQGRITVASERGVELTAAGDSYAVRGAATRSISPYDPVSVETWAPSPDPMRNRLVNVFALLPQGPRFQIYAATGGGSCTTPQDVSPGCFRLTVVESASPLSARAWNRAKPVAAALPTNGQEYAAPIRDPHGRLWLLVHMIRPRAPTLESAPNTAFWRQRSGGSALVMFPINPAIAR